LPPTHGRLAEAEGKLAELDVRLKEAELLATADATVEVVSGRVIWSRPGRSWSSCRSRRRSGSRFPTCGVSAPRAFFPRKPFHNGQQSAVALDILKLMDALQIQEAILAGFDWGGRMADMIAVLWPERCKALVSVSGYLISSPAANKKPLPPKAELHWWYQYYLATERGRAGYDEYRRDLRSSFGQLERRSEYRLRNAARGCHRVIAAIQKRPAI